MDISTDINLNITDCVRPNELIYRRNTVELSTNLIEAIKFKFLKHQEQYASMLFCLHKCLVALSGTFNTLFCI